jgi:hypothetical protein
MIYEILSCRIWRFEDWPVVFCTAPDVEQPVFIRTMRNKSEQTEMYLTALKILDIFTILKSVVRVIITHSQSHEAYRYCVRFL